MSMAQGHELVWWVIGRDGQHYAIVQAEASDGKLGQVRLVADQPDLSERPNWVATTPEEIEELLNAALTVARARIRKGRGERRLVVFIDDVDMDSLPSALLTQLSREGRRGGVILAISHQVHVSEGSAVA
jgi:hypothetical protein